METPTSGIQVEGRSAGQAPHQSRTATCACGCQRAWSVLRSPNLSSSMKPSLRQNERRSLYLDLGGVALCMRRRRRRTSRYKQGRQRAKARRLHRRANASCKSCHSYSILAHFPNSCAFILAVVQMMTMRAVTRTLSLPRRPSQLPRQRRRISSRRSPPSQQ